jgi:hypothetical protein
MVGWVERRLLLMVAEVRFLLEKGVWSGVMKGVTSREDVEAGPSDNTNTLVPSYNSQTFQRHISCHFYLISEWSGTSGGTNFLLKAATYYPATR